MKFCLERIKKLVSLNKLYNKCKYALFYFIYTQNTLLYNKSNNINIIINYPNQYLIYFYIYKG